MTSDLVPGATSRPVLQARGISKTFAGVLALDHLDFAIRGGEIHALLGENGSGKSTFIKILSGYYLPDSGGAVEIDGEEMHLGSPESAYALGCRFVHQDLGLVDTSSILDNLCLNGGFPARFGTVRRREAQRQATVDLERLGLGHLDPQDLVGTLTPATKTGVAVARALRADPARQVRLLVVDEPTATLPDNEVHQLLEILRQVASTGVAVLYVTHRLDEVFLLAHRVSVLRDGRLEATEPTASLNRKRLIDLLLGTEFDELHAVTAQLDPQPDVGGVLEVEQLRAGAVRGASFTVGAGDIVGIAGITGSGRETILGAIFGASPRDGGTVRLAGSVLKAGRPDLAIGCGMAYLPPDRKLLGGIMEFSARENISLSDLSPFWRRLRLRRKAERAESRMWFDRLNIRPADAVDARLSTFSGGNQQKVLFGKWLRCQPAMFLLDEPTQGVDVGAKAQLHRLLVEAAENGAGVLVSSSDVDELAALCRRVIVFRDGKICGQLTGPWLTGPSIARECLGSERETANS
ncbi:MAG TPA: sugar ABC transporter ATP-binding protein [Jatrophihabitantaceae bacterium]|jgi:ribose transport system ATP-binding protein|nr:sugar ABC transporter ATP-binding protein [Jatrophihabitantaceae bacterium]